MFDTMIHKQSTCSAKDILIKWLEENASDMIVCPENAVILCDKFPGFIDVSYLYNTWKGI